MSTIKTNSEGHVVLEQNNLVFVSGGDEIRARVERILRSFRGEWFLNIQNGMPYFQEILIKNPQDETVRAHFKRAILSTPGVTKINSLDISLNKSTRVLTVTTTFIGDEETLTAEITI